MELDDFKESWKNARYVGKDSTEHDEKKIMEILSSSRKSFRKSLFIESLLSITIYVASIIVFILFGAMIGSYLFKLVIITTIFTIPVYYRMYSSYKFLKKIDYGSDIKSNLLKYLTYHKVSLQIYKWGVYFLVAVLVVVFLLDDTFMKLDFWVKSIIFGYFTFIILITGPLVSFMYGKRLKEIEKHKLE